MVVIEYGFVLVIVMGVLRKLFCLYVKWVVPALHLSLMSFTIPIALRSNWGFSRYISQDVIPQA